MVWDQIWVLDDIRKEVNELKEQLSALTKKQQEIVKEQSKPCKFPLLSLAPKEETKDQKPQDPPLLSQRRVIDPPKPDLTPIDRPLFRKRSTSLTNISHNIANESIKSYKLPIKVAQKAQNVPVDSRNASKTQDPSLLIDVPNYSQV